MTRSRESNSLPTPSRDRRCLAGGKERISNRLEDICSNPSSVSLLQYRQGNLSLLVRGVCTSFSYAGMAVV